MASMATHEQNPLAIDVPETARLLGVSPGSVRNRIRSGDLPVVHVGRSVRIPTEAVRKFVDSGGTPRPAHPEEIKE